ncbi:MAG: hypothetical protein R2729_16320 [Bryobacteraceae bacterium]
MKILVVALLSALLLPAQEPVVVQRAELAVAFGTVAGKVVIVGDYLTFVDDEKPEASFAVARKDVEDLRLESGVLNVRLKRAIRDREGERTRLALRLPEGASPAGLQAWYDRTPPAAPEPAATKADTNPKTAEPAGAKVYRARHKHLFGGCDGRLVLLEEQINFESISDVGHSRRWRYQDVKELKRKNPFELKIQPFGADEYEFEIPSPGIDQPDYQALVDGITRSRLQK